MLAASDVQSFAFAIAELASIMLAGVAPKGANPASL
jgi:hypothetical protein